jgi:hypothetical protein
MAISFNPMSDEEARKAENNVFDEGTYPFLVIDCEHRMSKRGNNMLAVNLEVKTDEGRRRVRDWVMLDGQMAWQLRKFMHGIGMSEQYDAGRLDPSECIGQTGTAEFYIEHDEQYGDKNRVGKYLPGGGKAKVQPKPEQDPDDIPDDDIPF